MTNEEINIRAKLLAVAIPTQERMLEKKGVPKLERELELMNMSLMGICVFLAEIAKRLPEKE